MNDLLEIGLKKISLYGELGYVEIIDMMPRMIPEGRWAGLAVVQNARVSYLSKSKSVKADHNLLKFLMDNKHMSPFESVVLKFRVKCPLTTANQWFRHRTFSYNAASARYTKMPEETYIPDVRMQSKTNKQGSDESKGDEELKKIDDLWKSAAENTANAAWATYKQFLDMGVAKEVARSILPVNMMTEFIATGNLRNWLHFLELRMKPDAQEEIRHAAHAIHQLIKLRCPEVVQHWENTQYKSIKLSVLEQTAINGNVDSVANMSSRQKHAFKKKCVTLGI